MFFIWALQKPCSCRPNTGSVIKNVTFERGRGRLSYSTRVEQEQNPPADTTGTISGTVTDSETGAPIPGVSITLGTNTVETSSGSEGSYTGEFGNAEVDNSAERGDYVMITANKDGYTDFQTQVTVSGEDGAYNVDFSMAPVAATAEVPNPSTTPVDLPASQGGDQTGQLDIPPGSVLDDTGNPVTEPVTVEFTPIDPTDPADLAAFPGADFVAAGGDPNNPTTLESVVLAEVTLTGASGTEYSDLATPATIELLLPADLQASTNPGDVIPTWYYDEATGLWVEDGSAIVQACSFDTGLKCALFTVDHFTWWNVDHPVTEHGCFKGSITQFDGTTPVVVPVRALGVTYTGTSGGNRDYDDPATYGVSFKRSGPNTEQVKLFLDRNGQKQYLTNPTLVAANTYQYDLTLNVGAATVFDSPNFSGSTIPTPDTGICQALNIRVDFNLAPVVSVSGPGVPQTPGATVMLNAVVTDADDNYDPSNSANWDWSTTCGTLSNETATSADLTGSGAVEDCVVTLTATDDRDASGSDSHLVRFTSGEFVPGDRLTVTVLGQRGQPLDTAAWAFISDAGGNPITSVPCDDAAANDGACPVDLATGFVDFGTGFGGNPIDLTVVADLGFTGGEELPVTRIITFKGIPAGSLTVVVPNGGGNGQPALGATSRPSSLIADLLLGSNAQAAVGPGFNPGVILDYVTTPEFPTVLRAGAQQFPSAPVDGSDNEFDVYMEDRDLEIGGLAAFIGFGVDPTLPGDSDNDRIRYGFAVDQDPAAIGFLGSGNELHFDLDKTARIFDVTGPYASLDSNQTLAWRGGVSYLIDCDEPVVSGIPGTEVVCSQFPSDHYFYVAKDPVLESFDSQMLGALTPPGGFVTDALDVQVTVANGSIDPVIATAEVTLAGTELAQVDILRTDFRGFSNGFSTVVWSVFQPPVGSPVTVVTPFLPTTLSANGPVNPSGNCDGDFANSAPTITAMALHQESANDFYTMVQNARLLGDFKPIAPEQTGVFNPDAWPDALWLISADRLQGAGGNQCLSGGGPQ